MLDTVEQRVKSRKQDLEVKAFFNKKNYIDYLLDKEETVGKLSNVEMIELINARDNLKRLDEEVYLDSKTHNILIDTLNRLDNILSKYTDNLLSTESNKADYNYLYEDRQFKANKNGRYVTILVDIAIAVFVAVIVAAIMMAISPIMNEKNAIQAEESTITAEKKLESEISNENIVKPLENISGTAIKSIDNIEYSTIIAYIALGVFVVYWLGVLIVISFDIFM